MLFFSTPAYPAFSRIRRCSANSDSLISPVDTPISVATSVFEVGAVAEKGSARDDRIVDDASLGVLERLDFMTRHAAVDNLDIA